MSNSDSEVIAKETGVSPHLQLISNLNENKPKLSLSDILLIRYK